MRPNAIPEHLPNPPGARREESTPPQTSKTPQKRLPLPFWGILFVTEGLEMLSSVFAAEMQTIRRKKSAVPFETAIYNGRASLLAQCDQHWYVAVASDAYEESEQRICLPFGEGIAGVYWQRDFDGLSHVLTSTEGIGQQRGTWQHFDDELMRLTLDIKTILMLPIRPENAVWGVLSLDSDLRLPQKRAQELQEVIDLSREYADQLLKLHNYTPLQYSHYRALHHLVRTARLLPPLDVVTRTGIHWLAADDNRAYLIAASERTKSEWSTAWDLKYHLDQELVGQVLAVQKTFWEVRDIDPPNQTEKLDALFNKLKLTNPQKRGLAHTIRSVIGTPIADASGQPVAVLTFECEQTLPEDELKQYIPFIEHLALLAAKVLADDQTSGRRRQTES